MKDLLKDYYKKAISALSQWYWSLESHRRHTVGWTLVIASVLILGGSIWGVGYGVYSACVWTKETVQGWFGDEGDNVSPDGDLSRLPMYSGGHRHRKFECGELNKKRAIKMPRMFNDLNDTQLVAARQLGVTPMDSRAELEKKKDKLVQLQNTRYYCIDPMSHSVPYLVPDAADFLTSLGERWTEYHGTDCRFIITSCLRTAEDINKLRRRNVNSTKESCHRFGTTFDITYVRFDKHSNIYDGKLKEDLARALYDMREAGHCYVKYEAKQSCFHVTVRPR